ncbi:hypothetical protein SK128_013342 [Halocaridina rubra]|uniref:Uncharacterized protein n=1 Tax=Halocaridina rubra TaxID=373956 RepID=A0AAN8XCQ4_HALRR
MEALLTYIPLILANQYNTSSAMGSLQPGLPFFSADKYALQPEEMLINRLLNEILSGPLRDMWLTLLIDQDSEKLREILGVFFSNVTVPIFVLQQSKNSSFYLNEKMDSTDPLVEDSSVIELPSQKSKRAMVWTWMPFAVKRLVKLGIWRPDNFKEFNDLFVDRFKDMTRKTLPIYGWNEDVPFLFQLFPDEAPRGIGPMILETLSQWLHFNYSFTIKRFVLWNEFFDRMSNGTNELMINYGPQNAETYRYSDLSVPYHYEGKEPHQ